MLLTFSPCWSLSDFVHNIDQKSDRTVWLVHEAVALPANECAHMFCCVGILSKRNMVACGGLRSGDFVCNFSTAGGSRHRAPNRFAVADNCCVYLASLPGVLCSICRGSGQLEHSLDPDLVNAFDGVSAVVGAPV